jgi:simple sugar transport system substrate-binding protein
MAAGVLVLTSNNDTPNSGRELYFGQDLVGAAVVQGQMLAKLAGGKGKVAMTNCAPGSLALDQRIEGARQGVKAGGLQDVGVYNTNPADMASELGTIQDILRAHPDLAAMMPLCGPDTAAAGLVRKNQGHKIPIVGTDLLYQTLELIRDGYIDGTVGQQPYLQGYLPIMYAYQRVVLGAPKLELPGGNYFLANEIVTKDNVQQFLVREERFRG